MNKSEIVDSIAGAADISKAAAGRALDAFIDCIGGADDLIPYNRFQQQPIIQTPLLPDASVKDSANIVIPQGESNRAYYYDENFEFNFTYNIQNNQELYNANKSYALIRLKKMDLFPSQFHKDLFVISLAYNDNKLAFFKTFPIEYLARQPINQWREMNYTIMLPKIQQKDFILKFYIWNRGLDIFFVKDVEIKVIKTD